MSPTGLPIDEPSGRAAPQGLALFALGFRPFYLLAGVFAAASVGLWVLQYTGAVSGAYLRGALWHGHEMLFGFALAVVAGFLFTAVRNWTGQPTPTGALLVVFVLLWLAGRVLVLTPFAVAAAAASAAFPIAVAAAIAVPLARARNHRNYFFVVLLVLAGCANLAFHLAAMGIVTWPERLGVQAGLDLVLFIVAVLAGRVVPMFTNNGVPGAGAERHPVVEKLALGSVLALAALDVAGADARLIAAVSLVGAAAHAVRLGLWRPWRTFGAPLVWVLHASYAWIAIHLLLRALAAFGWVGASLATHALTLGVIGGMTLGMMTRTSRGHTGRLLVADRWEVACYVLVHAAAVVRVFGGWVLPAAYREGVVASGLLWSVAFTLFVIRYAPILMRPRVDGRPG